MAHCEKCKSGMDTEDDDDKPRKQLETSRSGGSGKGKSRIGSGEASDESQPGGPEILEFRPRALICEPNEIVRRGLKAMIEPTAVVIAEVADGAWAWESACRTRPHLIVTEVALDRVHGLELCSRICSEIPGRRVLIATDLYHATRFYNRLLRAGVNGIYLKSAGKAALLEALFDVMRGKQYCAPEVTRIIWDQLPIVEQQLGLSTSEAEILLRLDMRNEEIAEEIGFEPQYLEKHVSTIFNRFDAFTIAMELGFAMIPKTPTRTMGHPHLTDEELQSLEHAQNAVHCAH